MKLTIIFLLASFTAFGQVQMTDPTGAKIKLYNEADVPTVVVKDSVSFKVGRGVKAIPVLLWLEGIDTTKENTITIYVNKPKPIPPVVVKPSIVQTYFTDVNTSTKVTLGGTWLKASSSTTVRWPDLFEEDNVAYTHTVGDFVTYTFTGDSIQVIGERRENHGIVGITLSKGTAVIDTDSVDTYLATQANQPSVLWSSDRLPHGEYTVKVFFKRFDRTKTPARNSILLDGFRVFSTQQVTVVEDPVIVVPPPPTGDVLNVSPTSNVKSVIETASNKTILFAPGTYNLPSVFVPAGVSIDLGTAIVVATTPGNFNEAKAVFHFNSGSRIGGNQFIQGGTIRGNNIAACGIIVNNRDNVHIRNVNLSDFKFLGIWVQNASGGSVGPAKLFNTSGAITSWASGEVCFTNISNYEFHDLDLGSNATTRGYAMKALYGGGTVGPNVKFYNIKCNMNKASVWNNGQSMNIGLEVHDTKIIAPVEIYNSYFYNQMSLAIGHHNQGKIRVHHNTFDSPGTYAVETILDNFEFDNNIIINSPMMFANFQKNTMWSNWVAYKNKFINPAPTPTWGGIILVGGDGVSNVRIYDNDIVQKPGVALVKYMGVQGGVDTSGNRITQ
jgi:hypothetical protein